MRFFFLICFLTTFLRTGYTQQISEPNNCAQNCSCSIQGQVFDGETKMGLAYAAIRIKGTELGAVADLDGNFVIHKICYAEFDIEVSFLGYQTVSHHHDLQHAHPKIYLSPSDDHLESVVVEGQQQLSEQASGTESRLSAKTLERKAGSSLGQVLAEMPGLSSLATGQNVSKPVLHGLYGSRLLIITNGIRLESQSWGEEHAPEIDPDMAENITVIKGASSIMYGPGALAGVIVVDPPQPQLHASLKGSVGLKAHTNGRAVTSSLKIKKGYDRWAWVASAASKKQGDLQTPNYLLTNTGAEEASTGIGLLVHPNERLNLKLRYTFIFQNLGLLRSSAGIGSLNDLQLALKQNKPQIIEPFSYEIGSPRQQVNHHLINLQADYLINNSKLRFNYGYQVNHRQEFDVRRGNRINQPIIDLKLGAHSTELIWQQATQGVRSGTSGVQFFYQQNANQNGTNTTFFIPNFTNRNLGFFSQQAWEYTKLTLDAGLRLDHQWTKVLGYDVKGELFGDNLRYTSLSGSAGVSKKLGKRYKLQSQLATAWRPPNMAELYSYGKHGFIIEYGIRRFKAGESGVYSADERPAQPEVNFSWTNTLSKQTGKVQAELSIYTNYIVDYLYSRPEGLNETESGFYPYFVYDQGNALFSGFDGQLSFAHTTKWQSDVQLSLLYATLLEDSQAIVGTPTPKVSYALEYAGQRNKNPHLDGRLQFTYVLESISQPLIANLNSLAAGNEPLAQIFDFKSAPEAYMLVDFSLELESKRFTYSLGIQNALDTQYRSYTNRLRYFADDAGRNISFGLRYTF